MWDEFQQMKILILIILTILEITSVVVLGYILPVDLRKEEKMVEYKVIDRKDIPEAIKQRITERKIMMADCFM